MFIKRLNRNFKLLDKTLIAHKGIYGYTKNDEYVSPNTLKSCKLAIDNGINFECDIRNTKDNIPILLHNNVLRNYKWKKN